jgi:hypothetical protein
MTTFYPAWRALGERRRRNVHPITETCGKRGPLPYPSLEIAVRRASELN